MVQKIRMESKMLKYVLILFLVTLSACSPQISSPFLNQYRSKAEETFNNDNMVSSLDQILMWHQTNQTEIPAAVNPGKERTAIWRNLQMCRANQPKN